MKGETMTVIYCDICETMIDGDAYRLKLWHGENVYGFNDVCPVCAGKLKTLIDDMKEG